MYKISKEPKFNFVVAFDMDKKDIENCEKLIKEGNIQAKLDMISHNQLVMNHKLNKLLSQSK